MSYLYGLDPVEQNRAVDLAASHPLDPNTVKPSFFEGAGEGTATGLFSGVVAKPALLLGDAATPALTPLAEQIDKAFNTSTKEWLEREQQKNVGMLKALRDRQAQYGTAGQVVSGLMDVAPEAAAGFVMGGPAGAAATVGSLQGYADYRLGIEDGLDQATALAKGAITGLTNAAGVVIPMAKPGASLLANIGIGAGVNVGTGMAQRAATATLLEERGYGDMAKQYQWLDKEAIATDAILGSFFGGLAHYGPHGAVEPSKVDAALTTNEKLHAEIDTAPGIPKTPEARDAHIAAELKATEQLLRGEPVDVADLARKVDAIEDPMVAEVHREQADVLWEEMLKDMVDPKGRLEGDARFEAWARQLEEDHPPQRAAERGPAELVHDVIGTEPAKRGEAAALNEAARMAQDNGALRTQDDMKALAKRIEEVEARGLEAPELRQALREATQQHIEEVRNAPAPKVHDGTEKSMAKAGDVRPVEKDMARQVLERKPDITVANENGELVSAKSLLDAADRDIESAQREGVLHDVAVACFLKG